MQNNNSIKREQSELVCSAERENCGAKRNSSAEGWYINDFHRANSMAAQREVQRMSLHPYSREQKLEQIASLRQHSAISKESANWERSRKQ